MKNIFYLLLLSTFTFSCQKVIDVDLNEENAEIVIDATYTAKDSTVRVVVSNTTSYFDSSSPTYITDATVVITDQSGVTTTVSHIGNGVYELTNYIPNYNEIYTLNVSTNGLLYTAQSEMNPPVALSPITYDYVDGFFGAEGGYVVYFNMQDPIEEGDYYEIALSRNGFPYHSYTEVFTQDDKLTNGNFVQRPLFGGELYELQDTILMELRTITKDKYNYINEIQSLASGQSGAPGNPNSNWDNNALGFFSAYSSSYQEVIIQ